MLHPLDIRRIREMAERGVPLPRLKAVRLAKALTKERLAEVAGVHRNTVTRIEAGMPAEVRTMKALADALGVDPPALIGEA